MQVKSIAEHTHLENICNTFDLHWQQPKHMLWELKQAVSMRHFLSLKSTCLN